MILSHLKLAAKSPAVVRKRIEDTLTLHRSSGLWRVQSTRHSMQQSRVQYEKPLLNFNSNDYLGLSHHPAIADALKEGAVYYGSGAGSANTLSGYTKAHELLIETICEWLQVEDALLFSSGYMANMAVMSTIPYKDDHIYMDRLAHASLLDGIRLSEATLRRYPHQRLDTLANWLENSEGNWVVTESLFGMDGDRTDIAALSTLAQQHEALIYMDEAHALGVYGPQGAGLIGSHLIPLRLGTFSKALGLQGAFVAGDKALIDYCRQFSRPYLFTTALSPAIAHAAKVSIEIVKSHDAQRQHLYEMISYFKQKMKSIGIDTSSDTFIQPIIMNDCDTCNRTAMLLRDKGICVSSIRYPTVPKESPRIRVSLMAQHTKEDIDEFVQALSEVYDVVLG